MRQPEAQAFLKSMIRRAGTQRQLAVVLGLSERQIRRYVAGTTIPKVVVLALEAIDLKYF